MHANTSPLQPRADGTDTTAQATPQATPAEAWACRTLAGLMIDAGVGPAEVREHAATLSRLVPEAARFQPGLIAAYFDLTRAS
jgi:hypothetical protein